MENIQVKNRDEISKEISHKHIVLMPSGEEIELNMANPEKARKKLEAIGDKNLMAYVLSEELKGQPKGEPPSIKAMQKLELVGYEPSSDSGHFRFYPKGHLIFDLLRQWADDIAVNKIKAMQIDSPIIYDWGDKEIREQGGSFHERHYIVKEGVDSKKEFVLRFAGDFGLFKIMKDAIFSYKILPIRVYEYSKSFRYEKSGELAGFKRLRAFHMPDVHCFCRNIAQGWEEYVQLYKSYADIALSLGIAHAIGFRAVEDFYFKNKEKFIEMAQYSKRPIYIDLLSGMKHYWAVKSELQGIDAVGGNVQLSSVQLDVKDAQVYGINYVDSDGSKKGCVICHSSVGSIERWIYSILEEACKMKNPLLPLWLSPSQVRLIPVSEKHLDFCKSIALPSVRVEVDDSNDNLGRKIARAAVDWVPYIAVVGDKEVADGKLMVSKRIDGSKISMSADELSQEIKKQCEGKPFKELSMSRFLSMRPIFHG